MSKDITSKLLTLCLNSAWQPIGHKTVQDAISDLYAGNYKALDIQYDVTDSGEWDFDSPIVMNPLQWNEWVELPIRDIDYPIRSAFLTVRVPTILIATNYNKVPYQRSKLTRQNIRLRDKGMCQYTGKKLKPSEGNVDHIMPVSRGGENTWTNMVYCDKQLNERKGNKTPEEMGLSLIANPKEPKPKLASTMFRKARHVDWNHFIL